jgi:2-keto-4-pentenoate hydratase/2-oxohepta-3-ene-1,7-dioic acid hydratase in catechol pathway
MKLIRFQIDNRTPRYGWVHEDSVGVIDGNPFAEFRRREADLQLRDARLLPPVIPGKIVCIGRNYAAHAAEHEVDVPEMPLLFLKPPSSVIGPEAPIVIPPQSSQVEHEAELAVVIGRRGRWIDLEDTLDYVLGYTIANDVTARDLQRRDGQWTRGKGFDTFCPVGPWVETEFDPSDCLIRCHVNGELRQMASTRDMIFSIRQLIAFTSSVMTIEPGDILLTGTPAGVGPLSPGDEVEITIDGLGALRNPVEPDYHS